MGVIANGPFSKGLSKYKGEKMKAFEEYKDMHIEHSGRTDIKRRYSVTSDILSYRRCPRLYGVQAEMGFSPAQPSQMYVGSVIHQVLDRAHRHYSGKLGEKYHNNIPSDDDIAKYFNDVDQAMKAHGIRPFNKGLSAYVLETLQRFNRIEGPTLYPRVKDTEHRLQSDRKYYFLYGVVDVLVSTENSNSGDNSVEIWDYKGSKHPKSSTKFGKKILEDYTFQMLVYSSLFKLRNGYYPQKGVIYFLGELGGKNQVASRPADAILEVPLNEVEMERAIKSFDETVDEINRSRESDRWDPPRDGKETAGNETCDACDIRASCPSVNYPSRIP